MLWLNPSQGDVIQAPNRPSPAWVTVVGVKIADADVESTLEGLRRAMMNSQAYTLHPRDFEWVDKTGINIYAHEVWWFNTIKEAGFPYINTVIASDGTLEIRYDENAKDDTSKDTIRTKEISEDDSPLKRGGQRGTGKSGDGGGEEIPGGEEPSDEPSEEPPDEIIDDDFDPDGDTSQHEEDRDAYEEGKEKADSISDDLKEKMKEKMEGKGKPADESGPSSGPAPDGSEGGAPAPDPTGEAGEGTGDGQGTPTEGEGGGDGDADGGEGSGEGDGDGDGDGDSDKEGDGDGQGKGDGDGDGDDGNCDNCGGDDHDSDECDSDGGDSDNGDEKGKEMKGAAIITNFDGQYPMKIVMEDGTFTTSVSKYVAEHIQYGFVPSGFSIGYKGYVRADGENKGMIQFFNEDDNSKTGRSDWYITLIPSNVELNPEDGDAQPTDDPQDASRDGGDSEDTNLPPKEKDALDQCVEEAEDGKDAAEEAMQSADSEEAKQAAGQAREAADEAQEIVDNNDGNSKDQEKADEAEQYADEAEDFADLAEELEEEIRELFDESGLEEEDYEEFKEGLLDELFGEDSEFSDELTEREKRLKEKIERRNRLMKGRGLIRCVNWETGEIKSFPENKTIGDTWIQITQFFSPFESANGKQIVVDRTIAGAVEMVNAISQQAPKGMGIDVKISKDYMSAVFTPFSMGAGQEALITALKNMRMFTVNGDGSKITISY